MKIDLPTSTVTLAGRRFPAVHVICPPHPGDNPGTERERMLGGAGGPGTLKTPLSYQALIPCENGVLIGVETYEDTPGYVVTLHARTCQQQPWDSEQIWVPYFVGIVDGRLVAIDDVVHALLRAPWRWDEAEADWVVELIDRVNRMPFTQPDGPEVRPIPLADTYRLTV